MVSALPALLAAGGAVALALWMRPRSGNPSVPEPAKPVDLQRYLGLWYELGRYENRFEHGCEGVTAEYASGPSGSIEVINTCRRPGRAGRPHVARGVARIVPGSGNAKLKVSFFGPFFLGNYWVLDHADDYFWSLVGEPSGRFLWILCRDPKPDETLYQELLKRAAALGYDMTRFRRTVHDG